MTIHASSSWGRALLLAICVGLATIALYWPATHGEFVWDDDGLLGGTDHSAVDEWSDAIATYGKAVTAGAGVAYYRPILVDTFVLDYQLAGADPFRFHLTNVLLHGINAALVLLALYLFTRTLWGALVGTLLFAVHPLQAQAVGLVMGRNDELLIPPLLAMMVADEWAERRGRRVIGAVAIALAYAIELWVKETAVVLPILIPLTDVLWRGRSWRELPRRLPLMIVLAVITGLYFATRVAVFGSVLDTGQYGTLGPLGRLALATATLGYYLRLLVFPWGFAPAPYHAGLVDPAGLAFWIAAVLCAVATAITLVCLRRSPRIAYGLLFFVIAALPVLGIGALMKLPMLEHRAYLPMLGIALAVATLTPRISASVAGRVAIVVVLVGWSLLTFERLPVYNTSLALWEFGVRNVPESDYARNNLAAALMDANRIPEAVEQLHVALQLNPDYDRARYNLAGCLESLDRRDEAIAELQLLADRRPTDYAVLNRLALMLARRGDREQARIAFERARAVKPDDPIVARNAYDNLVRMGRYAEAAELARHLAELKPDDVDSWFRLGSTLRGAGRAADAVIAYQRALALGYDSAALRVEMAAALWDAGRPSEAVPHAERARALGAGNDIQIIQLLREAGFLDFPTS